MDQTCFQSSLWRALAVLSLAMIQSTHCWLLTPTTSSVRTRCLFSMENALLFTSNSTSQDPVLTPMIQEEPLLLSSGMGDIMGRWQQGELLKEKGHSLAEQYGIRNPLDRLLITANGNLQRLFAAYYDTEVSVSVLECTCRSPKLPAVWDRTVELRLNRGQASLLLCTAHSEITIRSMVAADAIASNTVGIGQWFRYANVLPTFELHGAGYLDTNYLWRMYTLDSEDMQCRIREDFVPDVWEL